MKIAIIDYGVGNLGSVTRSVEEIKATPILAKSPLDLHLADSLILPGVGNFTECINILKKDGWDKVIIEEVIQKKKPILGICLGMQLLATYGLEGLKTSDLKGTKGLGLIPGSVINLRDIGCNSRIPHVGWNEVEFNDAFIHEFKEIPKRTDFYFVHGYTFLPENQKHIIANTNYDISVVAAVRDRHIWGTQFHPEKSSKAGLKLIENFINNPICLK